MTKSNTRTFWTEDMKHRARELWLAGLRGSRIQNQIQAEYPDVTISGRNTRRYSKNSFKGEQPAADVELPVKKPRRRKPLTDADDIERELGQNKVQHTINANGTQAHQADIVLPEGLMRDVPTILNAHGFDPDVWDIVNATDNGWQQNSVKAGMVTLRQSKVVVKPHQDSNIDLILKGLADKIEPLDFDVEQKQGGQDNLVIPLADIHFGITTMDDMRPYLDKFQEIMRHGYKKIVIEMLGDFLHSDQIKTTQTVKATPLDDVNMVTAVKEGEQFMVSLISTALANADSVEIKTVGGNHDFDTHYMFVFALQNRYRNTDRLSIDLNADYRSAYLLGHVLIGIQHGDVSKRNAPLRLASEYKKLWGDSISAEIHSGHFHTEKTVDKDGVVERQFGTPKKADPYEIKNGFTGNKHELYALAYNDEKLIAEYHI